jgi:hypothetical protein
LLLSRRTNRGRSTSWRRPRRAAAGFDPKTTASPRRSAQNRERSDLLPRGCRAFGGVKSD